MKGIINENEGLIEEAINSLQAQVDVIKKYSLTKETHDGPIQLNWYEGKAILDALKKTANQNIAESVEEINERPDKDSYLKGFLILMRLTTKRLTEYQRNKLNAK